MLPVRRLSSSGLGARDGAPLVITSTRNTQSQPTARNSSPSKIPTLKSYSADGKSGGSPLARRTREHRGVDVLLHRTSTVVYSKTLISKSRDKMKILRPNFPQQIG